MSELEISIRLMVVGVLCGYLYIRHRRRMRAWQGHNDPAVWTGQALDVSQLRPRVEELRRKQTAARMAPRGRRFQQTLHSWVLYTVRQFGYFKDRKTEAKPF